MVVQVFVKKEPKLIDAAAKWGGTEHFFEMMRFDFVLDDKLNVYLMEANMSPNLSSKVGCCCCARYWPCRCIVVE
jgi:tubulin monoglycylase TTLL15